MRTIRHKYVLSLMLLLSISLFTHLWATVPDAVSNPYPANGATNVSTTLPQLTWNHAISSGGAPTGYKVSMWDVPHSPAGFSYKFEMYGKYYYLSNAAANYADARQACINAGGVLAGSFSNQINTLLVDNSGITTPLWLGLSDAAVEGTYVWENGREFSWTKWNTGEPSGAVEDYVELFTDGGDKYEWNDVVGTGTRRYYLELNADVINIETTATSFYDLNIELKPNTTYYWKATPFNGDGNGSSSTYSFTTGNSGSEPVATTVVSPSNGASGVALNPTLQWNSVAGADYYKLYIWKGRGSPDAYGNTLIGVYNGHAYYKSADAVGSVTWETARANCESYGAYLMTINSAEENDIAPGDVSYWIGMHDSVTEGEINWATGEPINYTNWGNNEPNGDSEDYMHVRADKKWNDNSGTATMRYLVEYPGTVLDGKVITGTSYAFEDVNLEPNSTYIWVVVPYNSYGRPWVSDYWSFTTGNSGTAPGTISAIIPSDGATGVAINTDLSWTAPSGSPTEYYVYFGTNNTIANAANYTDLGFWNGHHYYRYSQSTLPWCAAEAKAETDGGYLATIGSANENSKLAEASGNLRWFGGYDRMTANCWKYSNADPWAYTNWWTSQPSGGSQYYTQLNFGDSGRWDDDGDTASRYFLLETVPNIADGTKVSSPSYTPPLMRFNTTYYWSAVGSNNYGMANDTQRWSFTTSNGKAVNPTPANGATGNYSQAFDWDDVAGASGYQFYLGTSMGNWNLVNGTACPTSGYTYGGTLDPSFMYFWKVATVTPLETVQGNVWNFTTGALLNVNVTSTPTGAAILNNSIPTGFNTEHVFPSAYGSNAFYTVQMTDYDWTVDPMHDSNVITNLDGAKHINFIGTYHHVDTENGFEYMGEAGVLVTGTPGTVGGLPELPPNQIGLGDATIMVFSGTVTCDLNVFVPAGVWYVIAYYNGEWHQGNPYPQTGPGWVLFTDVPFGGKADIPVIMSEQDQTLPVELSSFTAIVNSDMLVCLEWVTQSETNVSGYYIYRNSEENLQTALNLNSFIPAQNTSTETTYSYTEEEVLPIGTYYYWLESLDMDGSFDFHGPITVNVTDPGDNPPPVDITLSAEMRVYPNPFNPSTQISVFLPKGNKVDCKIFNQKGELVFDYRTHSFQPGWNRLAWHGKDMQGCPVASGIYFVKVTGDKLNLQSKLILMK